MNKTGKSMIETKIYIGLNDSVTKTQKFEDSKYLELLKNVCCNYHVAFSVGMEQGGYMHENGVYTEENTLILTLIDTDEDVIKEIAKDLCVFFNQESVMVTNDRVSVYFINEHL